MYHLTASLLNINEAALTIDVLDKLAGLPDKNWQIQLVLVDNGSRPDQVQPLFEWVLKNKQRFYEVLFISASKNLGCTGGRNAAFKLTSSDRILILDNDIMLPEDSAWLEKLWSVMESDPKVAIAAPMLVFHDRPDIVQAAGIALTKTGRVGYLNRGERAADVSSVAVEVTAAPTACWLVRREAQQAIGFFSEEYYPVQYEDIDLCIRLKLAGWKIVCDRRVRIKHIENVTTRNLKDHPYARLTVRRAMHFKEKWADVLNEFATITEDEIYWGPISRAGGPNPKI
jgi:GT2 family glycosyltransferase